MHAFSKQRHMSKFEATSYHFHMVDWSLAKKCSPLILQNMTDAEQFFQIVQSTPAIPDFPCCSQDVEKLVKVL